MKYKIIVATGELLETTDRLEKKVKEMLDIGWQLQGGVSVSRMKPESYAESIVTMAQAMIKEE